MTTARPPGADRAPLAGIAALAAALIGAGLRPGFSLWYRDIHGYWSMQAECFVRAIAQGSLPLWNPAVSFGMPMLADPSYQVAYPFTWLNLAMGVVAYYKLYTLFHVAWAGAGFYLLLAHLGLERRAALSGAATWIASGPLLVVVSHTHHFAGSSWIPWVLLALDAALQRPSLRAGLLLGVAAALQVLAGSGDLCLMTAFLGTGWILARAWASRGARREWRRPVRALAVAGAAAAALSAVQWLPALALLRSGHRLGMSDAARMYWSLHPASLLDFLVPGLVAGLPLDSAARAALFESREPLFAAQYLGAAALVLAGFGALAARGLLRACAVVGLPAAVLLALGRHTPFYPILAAVTPLGLLRFPSKYVILVGFFWALLVALGVEAWLRGDVPARRRRAVVGLALGLAVLALAAGLWVGAAPPELMRHLAEARAADVSAAAARLLSSAALLGLAGLLASFGARTGRLAAVARIALLLLALGDLVRVGRGVNPAAPEELLTSRPSWSGLVPAGSRLYVSQGQSLELARVPQGWEPRWAQALGRIELAWPPLGARAGFTGSFDGDFTGLAPPLLSNLTLILSGVEGAPLSTRLLRLGGVDFVVTASDTEWPELEPVVEVPTHLRRPVRVFRVPRSAPDAYFVGRARAAGEPRSVLLLREEGFDPEREAVVAGIAQDAGRIEASGRVWEVARRPDRLELGVEASEPGYVVVLQTYDTGWRARVGAAPAALLRANVLFQAVAVPAGRSHVVLEYRPGSVVLGAAVSALGVLVCLVAGLRGPRRVAPGGSAL